MELMQANRQWASRPNDERFVSLVDLHQHFQLIRQESKQVVVPSRRLTAVPAEDSPANGLMIVGPNGHPYAPTHHAFGQIATLAEAPAGYLRTLPAAVAADCINYGLQFKRDIADVGILLRRRSLGTDSEHLLRAATGPNYGRIWNSEITRGLVERFGDGLTGDFRIPGEFGREVAITKANTTLFAGDRDMFVFLADERHRIEIPDRRDGKPGTLARGFFVWNSEVGAATFGIATFLFDYVCCNRIVWGATEYKQVRIRHTSGAPDRWLDEMEPAITAYANSSASTIVQAITHAKEARLGDKLDTFLAERFGKRMVPVLKATQEAEEGRPIESLWDVTTAATAYARTIPNQDERVAFERVAGDVMDLAA